MFSFLLPIASKIVSDAIDKIPDDAELGEKLIDLCLVILKKAVKLTKTKEPSLVSKSPLGKVGQFAKDNPALSIAAYDLGKGILSKIMKLRGPGVRGGTVGRRSAGSFTAT